MQEALYKHALGFLTVFDVIAVHVEPAALLEDPDGENRVLFLIFLPLLLSLLLLLIIIIFFHLLALLFFFLLLLLVLVLSRALLPRRSCSKPSRRHFALSRR
jgi:hypothetical protein